MTERQIIAIVRPQVVARDGHCRLGKNLLAAMGPCAGPSEWAHLGVSRRNNTKHLSPEERHTVAGSLMLCRQHHRQYDGHILGARAERLWIEERTPARANGPLAFIVGGRRFEESMCDSDPVEVSFASIYGKNTKQGLVEMTVGTEKVQMDVRKAREVATMLTETIEAAISDELLVKFLTTRIGLPEETAIAALLDFREMRQGSRDVLRHGGH